MKVFEFNNPLYIWNQVSMFKIFFVVENCIQIKIVFVFEN